MSEQEIENIEWNAENVLDALNDFERKPELTPVLENYLHRIAKNGEIVFPWCKLKPLLRKKMETVLDDFSESYPLEPTVTVPNFEAFNFESLKKTILQAVDSFGSAPFTIQRICELIINPTKHYNRTDKYMRGIEKNVLVVSTIEHRIGQGDGNANPVVNGMLNDSMRDETDVINGHENTDTVSSSNLNSPSNHVLLENFANVFPSAACIPSASNICINRDVDTNFLNTSECEKIDNQESDFDSSPPVEQLDSTPIKVDEAMDTSEDEQSNIDASSDSNNEVSSGTASSSSPSSEEAFDDKEDKPIIAESSESNVKVNVVESSEFDKELIDDINEVSDDVKNEAKCSESCIAIPLPDEVSSKPVEKGNDLECPQDDTVSQSDDDSHSASDLLPDNDSTVDNEPSEINESSEVEVEVTQNDDESTPDPDEVLENVTTSESKDISDQCMELESSTESTKEPPV